MFMNLGLLAKGRHGVNRRSTQAVGRSQKADMSSSLDTVLRRSQPGLSRPEPNYKDRHVTTAARL